MTTEAADEAIEVLNRIHKADPTVLPALIAHRVPCNKDVAVDPTVQVGLRADKSGGYEVGFLGVINGFFGVDDNTWGFIAAIYDDDGVLTHFRRTVPTDAAGGVVSDEITATTNQQKGNRI